MKRFLVILLCLMMVWTSAFAEYKKIKDDWMTDLYMMLTSTSKKKDYDTAMGHYLKWKTDKNKDKRFADDMMAVAFDLACELKSFSFSYEKEKCHAFEGLMKEGDSILFAFENAKGNYTLAKYDFTDNTLYYETKSVKDTDTVIETFRKLCDYRIELNGKTLSDAIWEKRNVARASLKKRPVNGWKLFE